MCAQAAAVEQQPAGCQLAQHGALRPVQLQPAVELARRAGDHLHLDALTVVYITLHNGDVRALDHHQVDVTARRGLAQGQRAAQYDGFDEWIGL